MNVTLRLWILVSGSDSVVCVDTRLARWCSWKGCAIGDGLLLKAKEMFLWHLESK